MKLDIEFYPKCIVCGETYNPNEVVYVCRKCGGLLDIVYDYEVLSEEIRSKWLRRTLSVWRYRELLPIKKDELIVSMGEGGTRLHECRRLKEYFGLRYLHIKNEGENPTGSFKDRGMTVGVTKALELGMNAVACASTGNTSASLAAYSAKAGLKCFVMVPKGKIAMGKLAQAIIYGANIIAIKGGFDDALKVVREICSKMRIYLLNSLNPYRLEGQKTIAMEIYDQLNAVPDTIIVPVGNAGNISAIWKGFKELEKLGIISEKPRMIGIQAEGASPIVNAIKNGKEKITPIGKPETIATAIRIGNPVNWMKALKAIRESNGIAEKVSDKEIMEAQNLLAKKEGIFVEPASATTIAGLKKLLDLGVIDKDEKIVCITTGNGLKDIETAIKFQKVGISEAEANAEKVKEIILRKLS